MPSIKYITDKDGVEFYPVTHERGVRDSDGVTLTTKLTQQSAITNNLGTIVASHEAAISAVRSKESVVAWDGDSAPVVANIPAGVSVTYNGNTYTGTLVADATTAEKEYLVSDGNGNYTRYIAVNNGGTYSWLAYGTTDIDLSDYKRIDSEVWLTEEAFNAIAVKDPNLTYNVYEEVNEI